jgi:hypothetical protein
MLSYTVVVDLYLCLFHARKESHQNLQKPAKADYDLALSFLKDPRFYIYPPTLALHIHQLVSMFFQGFQQLGINIIGR